MVRDSNNNIKGFERLFKNMYLDAFMYNLILPFETCLHLFKRCSLRRNIKFTFSCLTFVKRVRYVTTDNKLHNGTRFAEKYRTLRLKR